MRNGNSKDVRLKYALWGVLFGIAFPVISTLFDIYVRELGYSWASVLEAQRTQPLHWIIDTAPIFLGLFSCLAGIKQQEVIAVNEGLELKVQQRTEKLNDQNAALLGMQTELTDSLNRISQSINYAQRIQNAIVSNTNELQKAFPDSFVMFRPRDVVSGDFPWYLHINGRHYLAAVDCTGHGVPGAFMSLIGYFLLNKIVKENGVYDTGEILTELHKEVVRVLNQDNDSEVHDGMDLALCRIDPEKREIMFSGAGNPVYHLQSDELVEYKADFWSVGGTQYRNRKEYRTHSFSYENGDSIAMFSDGITDQFAADGEAKFGFKRIRNHLKENADQTMQNVQTSFEQEMNSWMGEEKQLDDMLFMGVRL